MDRARLIQAMAGVVGPPYVISDPVELKVYETDGFDEQEQNQLLERYQQQASSAVSGLAILNQQRSLLIDMLRHIAGLTT